MTANGATWRIVGDEVGNCNCDWGCPCQFDALPTHGNCMAMIAYQINEGGFGFTPTRPYGPSPFPIGFAGIRASVGCAAVRPRRCRAEVDRLAQHRARTLRDICECREMREELEALEHHAHALPHGPQ